MLVTLSVTVPDQLETFCPLLSTAWTPTVMVAPGAYEALGCGWKFSAKALPPALASTDAGSAAYDRPAVPRRSAAMAKALRRRRNS